MTKYIVYAVRTTTHEIEVEADSPQEAHESLVEWIADDFEPYITQNAWDFDIEVNE